jgi:hypothetical protein
MKRNIIQRRRIAHGCLQSRRSQATRERATLVLARLVQLGLRDLIEPNVAEFEIDRVVDQLAGTTDPHSPEGRALREAAKRAPGTLSRFLRRNPALVQQVLAGSAS